MLAYPLTHLISLTGRVSPEAFHRADLTVSPALTPLPGHPGCWFLSPYCEEATFLGTGQFLPSRRPLPFHPEGDFVVDSRADLFSEPPWTRKGDHLSNALGVCSTVGIICGTRRHLLGHSIVWSREAAKGPFPSAGPRRTPGRQRVVVKKGWVWGCFSIFGRMENFSSAMEPSEGQWKRSNWPKGHETS